MQKQQLQAIKLAIIALQERRRRKYTTGEHAYRKGIREIFARDDHKHYQEHSQAIQQLEDLKEILTDPGIRKDQMELFK